MLQPVQGKQKPAVISAYVWVSLFVCKGVHFVYVPFRAYGTFSLPRLERALAHKVRGLAPPLYLLLGGSLARAGGRVGASRGVLLSR